MKRPSQAKRVREFQAKVRGRDFQAGLEAAKAIIAPMIMRRYFVRGLAVGCALAVLALAACLWGLQSAGIVVLRLAL